jgi:hypothetical protein
MPRAKSSSKKASGANGDAGTNGATAAAIKTATSALQTSSAADNRAAQTETSRPSRATDTSVHPSVSEEQIRRRAYELYVQRGGTHGRHMDDWFRAESELRGRAS